MKMRLLSIGLIAIAMVFTLSSFLMKDAHKDFTLPDSKGNTHKLSDYKGKWVVLEWINFGCPFVKKHYDTDNMQKLQRKYTEKDVVWLSICSSAEGKQGHMEANEINKALTDKKTAMTAYLIDEDGKVGKMFKAKTTPQIVVINPDGKIVYNGAIDDIASANKDDVAKAKNYLVQILDPALAGEKVPELKSKPYGCSVKY